jgi:hypothetical protein
MRENHIWKIKPFIFSGMREKTLSHQLFPPTEMNLKIVKLRMFFRRYYTTFEELSIEFFYYRNNYFDKPPVKCAEPPILQQLFTVWSVIKTKSTTFPHQIFHFMSNTKVNGKLSEFRFDFDKIHSIIQFFLTLGLWTFGGFFIW